MTAIWRPNCTRIDLLWNIGKIFPLFRVMLIRWLVIVSTLAIRMLMRCPCNMISPYHILLEFSWFTFGIMHYSCSCVALLIIDILLVESHGFPKVFVSILCTSIFKDISNSTRSVNVSLSISDSLLISWSNLFSSDFLSLFNFLICVSKLWLWILRCHRSF